MLRRSLLSLFTLFALTVVVSAKPPAINISVEPGGAAYRVSITFTSDADGTTNIRLPNEWGGQQELFKAIRNISVSEGAVLSDTERPFVKTVAHKRGEKITVRYEIAQDFHGPLKNAVRYRPVTDASYIHWIGDTVWILPEWDEQAENIVSIEWKGFPKTWTIANSFAISDRKQKFQAKLAELTSAIFVAGDFRLTTTKAKGNEVNVAIRGKWQFRDAELAEMIRKVIETERDFFADHSQKYYLVTLVQTDEGPNTSSFGGTGLTDSFTLFATPDASVDRIRSLLAHEYAHNWIPGRLGRMSEPEQSLYWFSEGFTEFYTFKLLLNGGLITPSEFASAYNDRIRDYYVLPVRTAPNDRIVTDFWTDRNVQRLPYLRGFLFATNLDAEIRAKSGGKTSLDDAIKEMFAESKIKQKPLSFESLTQLFSRHLGRDASVDIKKYLIEGDLIVPREDGLGTGFTQEIVQAPVFELGFDFDKFAKDRIVADVDPNSSAYAAGLRNGQKRNGGVSLAFGDTTKEIELKVKDDEGEKTIKFLPVARERVKIPLYITAQ
jgi:predicted metalloprotease with PDZ domain